MRSKIIMPRYTVIATGSGGLPDIPGLADIDYLTNETVFDLTRAPRHIVIIGGGPLGVEMAQALRRLGSRSQFWSPKRFLPKAITNLPKSYQRTPQRRHPSY